MSQSNASTVRTFTPAERVVLEYIRAHESDIPELDVRTLAHRAGASTATVVRLAKKMGFSGYAEYRFALSHGASASLRPVVANTTSVTPVEEALATARLLRVADVEQAADALAAGSPVLLMGDGLSHVVMEYLHHYLFSASRPSSCLTNYESAREAVLGNGSSAVVVCASPDGSGGSLELARLAHDRGMFVIGITCSLMSELVTFCDVVLLAMAARGASFDSQVGILTVVDVLARTYAHRHPYSSITEAEDGS